MSQVTKDKSIPSQLPVVEQHSVPSLGDRLIESLRPHSNLILLSVAAFVLLFVALAWMFQIRQRATEGEWMTFNQQLSVMSLTGNTSGIKEISEEFPEGRAGLWGLMLAGHFELDQGLRKLGSDRTEGLREIEKAKTTLKKVVDAPAAQKSTLLQVRSTYSLAYAYESLGEFQSAKALFQQLVDQAPESAFGIAAKRGFKRCSDPSFARVYEKFTSWEDPFAIAPGAPTAQKQDISFPELPESTDAEKDQEVKDQTEKSDSSKTTESDSMPLENSEAGESASNSETASPEKDQEAGSVPLDDEKADDEKADDEKADDEKADDEKADDEKD